MLISHADPNEQASALQLNQSARYAMKDLRDQPVTASQHATVDGINDFVEGLLGYEAKAATIVDVAMNDDDCVLANAYAAMACMFLESRAAPDQASAFISRATAASRRATERERMVLEAASAWVDDDMPRAIAVSEELASRYPRELATAKVCQYHYFNLGDAPGLVRIAGKVLPANTDVAHVHGMQAFAYEQAHMLPEAESAARRAIELKRKEPWAHHALAHVFLTQGRTGEARRFLDDVKETWTGLNSFMFTHNWWHLALVLIDQGEAEAVLDLYDGTIWGIWKEYSQDQVGAVSLLARLELQGINVGDRWEDVADYLEARIHDHVQPFLTVQYLYGLARAGRPRADDMMQSIRDFAGSAPTFVRSRWNEVALPACEGLLAHARGDYETTVQRLGSVLPRMAEIGGSHAQRDLFDQVWLDALLHSGRLAAAQRILEQRRVASPEARPAYGQLAALYGRLGLAREAEQVTSRAPQRAFTL